MYNKKVLIVDDSKESVRLTSFLLSKYKCEIDVANDGVEAVNKLLKQHYDLIILDCLMPRMGGLEAIILADHKINHRKQNHNIKIVASDTSTDHQKTSSNTHKDFSEHLHKNLPPTPVILYTGVENVDLELPFVENFDVIGYWSKGESIPHLIEKLDYMINSISTDSRLAA